MILELQALQPTAVIRLHLTFELVQNAANLKFERTEL